MSSYDLLFSAARRGDSSIGGVTVGVGVVEYASGAEGMLNLQLGPITLAAKSSLNQICTSRLESDCSSGRVLNLIPTWMWHRSESLCKWGLCQTH